MMSWPHSGFGAYLGPRIEEREGQLRVARYSARAPVAESRRSYDAARAEVELVSDRNDGPCAGVHRLTALEFLARWVDHVPERYDVRARYAGAYATRRRVWWRRRGIELARARGEPPGAAEPEASWPALRARRRRWAELLRLGEAAWARPRWRGCALRARGGGRRAWPRPSRVPTRRGRGRRRGAGSARAAELRRGAGHPVARRLRSPVCKFLLLVCALRGGPQVSDRWLVNTRLSAPRSSGFDSSRSPAGCPLHPASSVRRLSPGGPPRGSWSRPWTAASSGTS
jgi:putative transposase